VTLGNKQRLFTHCIGELIRWAYVEGFELTFGDAYRDARVHGEIGVKKSYSHSKSVHKQRLAVDFNLFKNGKYLTDSQDYQKLGEYWETLNPSARWGGRFNDGNHFSFEHNGVK
jgi:hypothetical protein